MKYLLPVLLLAGCTSVPDDRMCLDWKSYEEVIERCTPLYGNLICVWEKRPRHMCVLYDESSTKQQNIHGNNTRVSEDSNGGTDVQDSSSESERSSSDN